MPNLTKLIKYYPGIRSLFGIDRTCAVPVQKAVLGRIPVGGAGENRPGACRPNSVRCRKRRGCPGEDAATRRNKARHCANLVEVRYARLSLHTGLASFCLREGVMSDHRELSRCAASSGDPVTIEHLAD